MQQLAPAGLVYQAGTLSGNPLAMAAGLETLRRLARKGTYEKLEARSQRLAEGLHEQAGAAGVELTSAAIGGLFGFFFHPGPVENFADASRADVKRFKAFFAAMLEEGIYLAPSPFECGFVSLAHRRRDVEATLEAAGRALRRAARAH
jgi:glutamate-1-semialdehyde 2,1-aminomutase